MAIFFVFKLGLNVIQDLIDHTSTHYKISNRKL